MLHPALRHGFFVIAPLVAMLAYTSPARADLDYSCLKQCVAAGRDHHACLQACRYTPPSARPHPGAGGMLSRHDLFVAPRPLAPGLVLPAGAAPNPAGTEAAAPAPTMRPLGHGISYQCVASCAAAGSSYDYCRSSCAY